MIDGRLHVLIFTPREGCVRVIVTSRMIVRSFLEEFRPLAMPVLEGVDGRSALQH